MTVNVLALQISFCSNSRTVAVNNLKCFLFKLSAVFDAYQQVMHGSFVSLRKLAGTCYFSPNFELMYSLTKTWIDVHVTHVLYHTEK